MKIPKNYKQVEGSERLPAPGARDIGPANPEEHVSVTIVLRRRPDAPQIPDVESFSEMRIGSRRRMGDDEFASKYGALPEDIQRVTDFARSLGLSIVETNAARRTIVVSGTVAQMTEAFAVSLHLYEPETSQLVSCAHPSEHIQKTYRGRSGSIYVPADLVNVIVGVFGLDNRSITKRNGGDPPNTTTLPVQTVARLYNFPTNSAAGQTIAILSEAGYQPADIKQYFQSLPSGFTEPTIIDVSVDANNSGIADAETTQDICIASTVAQGAQIAVYFTTYDQKGWVDLIGRVAHPQAGDPLCSVLSSSFYVSDGDDAATLTAEGISISWLNAVTAAFQDAAIQGITVCIASGDTGTDSKVGDGKAHLQYPASDPWVLSCGGTTVGNVSGLSFDEYVWNDNWGATGGGISDFFGLPVYQKNAGVPGSINDNHAGRGAPDIAANSSPNSGYPMIVNGNPFTGNGTSASAPLIAGLIAILNAALGKPVGFLNPTLYELGNSVVRDIQGPPGPLDNGFNGVPGYPAGSGWDASTGWGVIDGNALLAALRQLATAIADSGDFGSVCLGSFVEENLTINNKGSSPLYIFNIISSSIEFMTPSVISYPLVVSAGGSIDLAIRFQPFSFGAKSATLTLLSSDPVGASSVAVSGFAPAPSLNLLIADGGNFGNVCVGSLVDEPLTLFNSAPCPLAITNIASSESEFLVPQVMLYPITIAAGCSLEVPIRFQPASFGPKIATITIESDDPTGSQTVTTYGFAPTPSLNLLIADGGNFGNVCVGSLVDEPLTLCNSSSCTLSITNITSSESEFLVPQVLLYPITIAAGCSLEVPIRFQPASFGSKIATITIDSDDPIGPQTVLVSGFAPSGKLAVTGSLYFGGVRACCRAERTISICNVGDCDLHVSSVAFKRKNRHWKLINNPFPATLHPGSCLGVVVRYKATEKCPVCCELIIMSDDPILPVKALDVIAHTIWDECSCKKCCDDGLKDCCTKRHTECCREGNANSSYHDEEEEDEDEDLG